MQLYGVALIHDFYVNPLTLTLGNRAHQRTNLFGDAALTANHLTHVIGVDTQLKDSLARASDFSDTHRIGVLHQILGDVGEKFLQCRGPSLKNVSHIRWR